MAVGKRRTAREIAVQMLYQRDLGGSTLPQVFASFDIAEHLTPEREDAEEEGAPEAPSGRMGGATPPGGLQTAAYAKRRKKVEAAFEYAKSLVEGVAAHADELDELIRSQADNWRLERMPPVDRNILRLAVFEMLYEKDIPKLVVVDEAIELAKKYGSEQSSRFVNGLLDGLLKTHTFPGSLK